MKWKERKIFNLRVKFFRFLFTLQATYSVGTIDTSSSMMKFQVRLESFINNAFWWYALNKVIRHFYTARKLYLMVDINIFLEFFVPLISWHLQREKRNNKTNKQKTLEFRGISLSGACTGPTEGGIFTCSKQMLLMPWPALLCRPAAGVGC